jgi:hypothetical protein
LWERARERGDFAEGVLAGSLPNKANLPKSLFHKVGLSAAASFNKDLLSSNFAEGWGWKA